jgi:tetrahydromethanopterin S-methyltransferase subunit G
MADTKSNELLAHDITYVKERLTAIEKKLDEKYVSHETFDLTVQSLNLAITAVNDSSKEAMQTIVKTAMWLITPIYIAVIGLVIKAFTQ